jgi:hypothetical protein
VVFGTEMRRGIGAFAAAMTSGDVDGIADLVVADGRTPQLRVLVDQLGE